MLALFKAQKKEVLEKLEREDPIPGDAKATAALYLFGRKKWEKTFREFGNEIIKAAVLANGVRVLSELAVVGISFDIKNPRAVSWIKNKVFRFAYEVNNTTLNKLRNTLIEALENGESIKKIAERVEEIFGFAEDYRNEMIARTEIISATNYGAYEAIQQSGLVTKKIWIATIDERTRDTHEAIDGEVVEFEEEFSNGLQFPGDPDGELDEIINCRCTFGHLFPGDPEYDSN